jgi:hypothetical protein
MDDGTGIVLKYNPYSPIEQVDEQEIEPLFNINIADYDVDDIFKLLQIEIDEDSHYETVKKDIIERCDKHIEVFKNIGNVKMADFFESIKKSFLGDDTDTNANKSEAQQLLIAYTKMLDAEKNRGIKTNTTDTTDKSLFDANTGAGNPINRRTVTKLLNIDSRFRNNYYTSTSTDYKIDLPYPLKNIIEMKLSDLEFPATYYPFNEDYENNYFWIRFEQGNGANVYVYIYIPPGNYYHTAFMKVIQDSFDNLGVDLQATFNLSYENTGGIGVGDGHVTIGLKRQGNITSITEVELNFRGKKLPPDIYNESRKFFLETNTELINEYYYGVNNISYQQRVGWMMGYRKEIYTGEDTYESEGILDIIGPKYLYLILNDFNNSSNINFFNSSEETMLKNNIIARISVKGYAFSIQSQTDLSIFSEPRYYYGPVDINKLQVKLIDEYGRTLNLNDMDFSFTLSCISIYSQE